MKDRRAAILGVMGLAALLFGAASVEAQTASPPDATATRPAKTPGAQTSLPAAAPPAGTKQTTGATDHSPTVSQMNKAAKSKVEVEGK